MSGTATAGMVHAMRALATTLLTAVLLALAPTAANAGSQNPPKVPSTTRGTKACGTTKRFGFPIRVYVTKNKRLSCRRAKQIMRRSPMKSYRGWDVFDWTKGGTGGGPGPWSDVWTTKSRGTVVTGIIKA